MSGRPATTSPRPALIVVPTYNERENVAGVAAAFLAARAGVELLFVDDNSPDGTGDELDKIAAAESRVHVLHRPGKLGLGTAYLDGFAWGLARHYFFFFEMDADGSHDPAHLPAMFALLEDAHDPADVAVGSRWVDGGGTVNWGVGRQVISRGGSLYARTILGVGLRDLTSGFIGWSRHALEAIDLGTVRSNGYSFQIEMKYRAVRAGLKVRETPITFVDRRVGQSKMSRKIFAEALVMVWRLRLGTTGS